MLPTCTFETDALLQPISEEAPCGTDPRADGSPTGRYLQAKDARAAARRAERANDVDGEGAPPRQEWAEVVELTGAILMEEAKDLEVAAWLVEGLVRVDGLAGFYTGLKVTEGLVDTFWDAIFPQPDEDGEEPRLLPFIGLNGADGQGILIQPLRMIPVTGGGTSYAFWQYEQALDISHITDEAKREARLASGGPVLDAITQAVQATPASFYRQLVVDLQGCLTALDDLSSAFSARVGVDAPPAGSLRNVLNSMLDAVNVFASDKLAQSAQSAEIAAAEVGGADGSTADGDVGSASIPSGTPSNREEAFRQLLSVAAYFRKTEPHSPISYSLEEIVRRGRMNLGQLLEELIVDADARRYFYIASGLKAPAPAADSDG